MNKEILREAQALSPYLTEIFTTIHRNPELSTQEYKTQALILRELEAMGIEAKPIADTGVLGIIRGGRPGKTVAFRADMDALPIQEETNLPYASEVPGVMHACGHDTHVTILLGAARLLAARRESLQGNVKLFFQPAEETVGGAKRMIAEGCMKDPHVDAVFYSHCGCSTPTGSIWIRSGPNNAASNPFTLTFRGKGAHAASPHRANDVIVAASQAVVALQTICSRRTDPTDSVVLSVGSFHAGTAGNVLPETAVLNGIIRTVNPVTRANTVESFRQIVGGIAAAMGVEAEIDVRTGFSATVNDAAMTQLVKDCAADLFGAEKVIPKEAPSMGTEDVGYFMENTPGCYYNFGVANPEKGYGNPTHSPFFAADPDALPCGAALYTAIALRFLSET